MRNQPKKVVGVILLLMLLLGAVSAILFWRSPRSVQQEVADTRNALRQQGFKTDLADFNLTTDADTQSREAAITFFTSLMRPGSPDESVELLPLLPDGSAVPIWKQTSVKADREIVAWTDVQDGLEEIRPELDAACDAVLAGPIQFNLDARGGSAMLLPHLAAMRRLGQTFGNRIVAELHDDQPAAAWTNLLALTRLVTAWRVEPAEVSHLVRFSLAKTAFDATWQALQYRHWRDDQLAAWQHEWESVNYFTNLPETLAFKRASDTQLCQQSRRMPMSGLPWAEIIKESAHSPGRALTAIRESWNDTRYRNSGTFEDEKNLLLFDQKLELEMRRAITAPTWAQMRTLPGVTNQEDFVSPYHSRLQAFQYARRLHDSLYRRSSLLANAATAEAHRRLIVTAIALERFRQQTGTFPASLAALVPKFLATPPVDFMDGQPLRYHRTDDGEFQLYSVGLDCVDDGGTPPVPDSSPLRRPMMGFSAAEPKGDLLWPRPATTEAVTAQFQDDLAAARASLDKTEEIQAVAGWNDTASHQAGFNDLLAAPPVTNLPDVRVSGVPLSELLRNPASAGTNPPLLLQMLTLRQIRTGDEPETVTFQFPIAYDALTNYADLELMVDTNNNDSDSGCRALQTECRRAANGDCLLVWETIYEAPGPHALQAALSKEQASDESYLGGPLFLFTNVNLCQFSLSSAHFDPALGSTWRAKLPEANATYVVHLTATNGTPLKTLSGSTSNGQFTVFWDLVDDHGQTFTGSEFNSTFQLRLPDSGRTQTLRGP